MLAPRVSSWRARPGGSLAAVGAAMLLSACGNAVQGVGGPAANSAGDPPAHSGGDPPGRFEVRVRSSFPARQRLAAQTRFVVRVTNIGHATIPNVAVTVTNPRYGDAAQAFGLLLPQGGPGQPILASRTRPVWIVEQAPGPCAYSCRGRGPGAAATAYTDTWALGRLSPGALATFDWRLEAVRAGTYSIRYRVAAQLSGRAMVITAADRPAGGQHTVTISSAPQSTYVEPNGSVHYSP